VLSMVVEDFHHRDRKAVYRRFRDKGRMMPDGLRFVGSWVTADMGRCFQVMDAWPRWSGTSGANETDDTRPAAVSAHGRGQRGHL
jgi:Protein of unknown function (DUF3303)